MTKKSTKKKYALVTGIYYGTSVYGNMYRVVKAYNPVLKHFYVKADLLEGKQLQEIESCIPGDTIQYKTVFVYPYGYKQKEYQIVKNISAAERLDAFEQMYPELVRDQR
jgi:hypothetical protein